MEWRKLCKFLDGVPKEEDNEEEEGAGSARRVEGGPKRQKLDATRFQLNPNWGSHVNRSGRITELVQAYQRCTHRSNSLV